MGFMDKAKKLAEQAQEKLDEAQKNFGGSGSKPSQGGGVRYDEHGRPIEEETPAATTPPPTATPAPSGAAPDPGPPVEGATGGPPASAPEQPERERSEGGGGADSSPDPFKPLQQ